MQVILGSVRRSLVFRASDGGTDDVSVGTLVDKISSRIRKSRVLSRSTDKDNNVPIATTIRWRKGELIGCGAFGQVYMGMNLDSGELLAVKQVLIVATGASKEKAQVHIRELEEEVKLLKNLSHPNIVRYLGTVREEETINILLEFVAGGSISSLLGKFGPFPEAVIRMYTKQLLLGLDYLHKNGIMHRDIKGANILVDNKGCIKLADFGASKQVVELATVTGVKSMKGTPYWMAPEVILQTGQSFSADIWSVGCTVIEMATGKPPWSQQYQEVAALFYIGTTKSHPPIPDHLSPEAKDLLLKCLQKEPELRPPAFELLQHPFVTGESMQNPHIVYASSMENIEVPSCGDNLESFAGSIDVCNLGTLNLPAVNFEKLVRGSHEGEDNNNDCMCQIDDNDDEFMMYGCAKLGSVPMTDDIDKSFNPVEEPSNDWTCNYNETRGMEEQMTPGSVQPIFRVADNSRSPGQGDSSSSVRLSEDDDELTESKIKAFLDEKALELKKLQTPLYEDFYNSVNPSCSSNIAEPSGSGSPNYLKLPPKSRSPSPFPTGTPSKDADSQTCASPGSSSRCISNVSGASAQSPQDILYAQQESNSQGGSLTEVKRKWEEELVQELEQNRERRRQVGVGGITLSPVDRGSSRQRSRFASPANSPNQI